MNAITNTSTLQLLPSPTKSAQTTSKEGPLPPIQEIRLNEMLHLSTLTNFLVVIAASDEGGSARPFNGESDLVSDCSYEYSYREFLKSAKMRTSDVHSDSDVMIGDVKVNFATMEASRRGKPIYLTALEFKTMKYLIAKARRVVTRDELLNEVWGYQNYPTTRTVDNQVAKLRKKIEEDPARPVHFRTVHGVGYKFLP